MSVVHNMDIAVLAHATAGHPDRKALLLDLRTNGQGAVERVLAAVCKTQPRRMVRSGTVHAQRLAFEEARMKVLSALADLGPYVSALKLARFVNDSQDNVRNRLNTLCTHGYVGRGPGRSGRAAEYWVTHEGEQRLLQRGA